MVNRNILAITSPGSPVVSLIKKYKISNVLVVRNSSVEIKKRIIECYENNDVFMNRNLTNFLKVSDFYFSDL
jgi:hypothetical protein